MVGTKYNEVLDSGYQAVIKVEIPSLASYISSATSPVTPGHSQRVG